MIVQLDGFCVSGRLIRLTILFAVTYSSSVAVRAGDDAAAKIEVARWKPREFAFIADAEVERPFQVPFSATVRGPNGAELKLSGYYDGQRTWKLRIAPPTEGNWSLVTHSSHPSLDKRTASFVCVKNTGPKTHGGLRVDPKHPHTFIHEDGSRFFPLGYECDWLWALDHGAVDPKTLHRFLDTLAAHGFNYLVLNAYAHDTSWRAGKTGPDDFGPFPVYPWEGSNETPDHARLNLVYWQHFDRVVQALYDRGIIAHLMIKVYNKKVRWPAKGSAEDDLYFRTLIARYAGFPNVVWDFSKEAHNEKDLDYKTGRLRFVREHDPFRRLITVHDDNPAYESGLFDQLVDYRSDQQHKLWHETILAQRRQRAWPVFNVEFGYEQGPGGPEDKTYRIAQPAEELCRRAWEISMAGGFTVYYYTYTAWDVIRPQDVPAGYAHFKRLRDFFEGTGYWRMKPAAELVDAGYCLTDPGREYIVFLNRVTPVTVKFEGLAGPLAAEWYQPLTGKRMPAGQVHSGAVRIGPPADWNDGPAVLHVVSPQSR